MFEKGECFLNLSDISQHISNISWTHPVLVDVYKGKLQMVESWKIQWAQNFSWWRNKARMWNSDTFDWQTFKSKYIL